MEGTAFVLKAELLNSGEGFCTAQVFKLTLHTVKAIL